MVYTDEQKKIIQCIYKNKVITFYDLLQFDKKFIIEKYKGNIGRKKTFEVGENIFIINKEEEFEIIKKMANIINLCTFLKDKNLINIIDIGYNHTIIPFYTINELGMQILLEGVSCIIEEYTKYLYISTPAMDEFIKNEYKTNEELELKNEVESREKAEKITRRIAIISIIITFLIGLSTIVFNFGSYKKERNIIINYPDILNNQKEVSDLNKYFEIQENDLDMIDEININDDTEH